MKITIHVNGSDHSVDVDAQKTETVVIPQIPYVGTRDLDECRRVFQLVAETFELKPEWLRRRSQVTAVSHARTLAMWLCRRRTALSFPLLGKIFARHHSTVVVMVQRAEKRYGATGPFSELAAQLEARLDVLREGSRVEKVHVHEDHDIGDVD